MTAVTDLPTLEAAIQLYFDVLYECDMAKFDLVFHPACNLYLASGNETAATELSAYRKIVAGRKSPESLGLPREESVEAIQIAGRDLAVVTLLSRVFDKRYKDCLTLARDKAGWRVVAKAYVLHEDMGQS